MNWLNQGRIVYPTDAIPDPQGNNPKLNRPFIVITPDTKLPTTQLIKLVGVTAVRFEGEPEENYVELPTGDKVATRLKKGWSAAFCAWVIELPTGKFTVSDGFVRAKELVPIIKRVLALGL